MAEAQFTYTQGDTLPILFWKIDPLINLTGATVTWSMDDADGNDILDAVPATIANGTYLIDGVSTALTPADGVVFWTPQPGNTAQKGIYRGSFEVTLPGGGKLHSPNKDYIEILVQEAL